MDGQGEGHPAGSLPTSPTSQNRRMSNAQQDDKDGTSPNRGISGMSGLLAERMAEGGGALCNDENGLCLGSRGDINTSQSGVYTAIAKLACQLDSTVDGTGGGNRQEVPLVSIQTDSAALLVKEYGGRTVVFRVPTEASMSDNAVDGEAVNAEGQPSADVNAS